MEIAVSGMSNRTYRGSSKHKNRPVNEMKGTLCPEWTHVTKSKGLSCDMYDHNWGETEASRLFKEAIEVDKRYYATKRGIAFEAKATGDGSYHGFPIPWESVPSSVKNQWLDKGLVTKRQIKKSFNPQGIYWAYDQESDQ